mgnify:CR=1 FL=1
MIEAMSAPSLAARPTTYADLRRLPPDERWELIAGAAYAMTGPSWQDQAVSGALLVQLLAYFRARGCRVLHAPLDVRLPDADEPDDSITTVVQPDLSVVCNQVELDPEDRRKHTIINPTLLVEVLSPSTEAYDRGEKLAHYKRIPALQEVVLVAHDEDRIDVWRRSTRGWTLLSFRPGQEVVLESLHGIRFPVDDVYLDRLAL